MQSAAKVWCACVGGIKNTGSVRSKADALMTAEETHEATSLINGLKPSGLKSETTRLVRGVIKIVCNLTNAGRDKHLLQGINDAVITREHIKT